ncbi:hypothetical protein [Patulibacter minatonensis]|uniref:hypothetical protein n=1 Tax=Patulibacter minatonensis TaxID=298163 RepID=UPI000479AD99|nr:hypothetical protein [Patulibacter minatonensis]
MQTDAGAAPHTRGDGDTSLRAFAALLAVALVLHVLWWHGVVVRSPWLLVVVAAAFVLARPSSVVRLAVLLAVAAAAIVAELPALGTHLLLVLAVAATVLTHLAVTVVRGPRAGPPGGRRVPGAGELWPEVAPFLRALVVVLYVAAVLSKLNHGYLDPGTSPAAALSAKVVWFDPGLLGAWRVRPAIWGSLLVEASLPVLLLLPRTRTLGLVVGLGFHAVLALSGTVPFTALLLAFYVAFLPAGTLVAPDLARRGATGARWVVRGGAVARTHAAALAATAAALWVVVGLAGSLVPGRVTGGVLASATRVVVVVASLGALALVVARARRGREPARPAGAMPVVFRLGIAALVLCAATPYLGLRVGDAFTMYSGLRTGAASWNHLFVPEAVRILD